VTDKPAPLAGLKVVELARILAGPWMGQVLADLGADVIKIESPAGDDTRQWGPPFVSNDRDAAYFHSCNRGKRSVTADFTNAQDLQMVLALVRRADVLIENFKVGGLSRFGLDYAAVHAINPTLVYCSVTGFGQDGPYAERAGYDAIIQAMSGIMSMTGEANGPPQKMGVAFADIFAGLYGVIGIQAALAQRQTTGQGQHLDIALLDCMVGVLANQNLNYLVSGQVPGRLGSAHPNIVPYQVFATADGARPPLCDQRRTRRASPAARRRVEYRIRTLAPAGDPADAGKSRRPRRTGQHARRCVRGSASSPSATANRIPAGERAKSLRARHSNTHRLLGLPPATATFVACAWSTQCRGQE